MINENCVISEQIHQIHRKLPLQLELKQVLQCVEE